MAAICVAVGQCVVLQRESLVAPAPGPRRPRFAKRHHPSPLLVPQREPDAGEALLETNVADLPERGMVPQNFAKPVERNAARQVMHVMHADIAGEPVERRRQFVERTAMQRRLRLAPVASMAPRLSPRTGAARRRATRRPSHRA